MLIPDKPQPTPFVLAVALTGAGWVRIDATDWTRPGEHSDRHSWPVAELVLRHGWPHIDPPPALPQSQPESKHPWRNRVHRPRRGRPPAPAETVDAVRDMRAAGLSFPAIADRIGLSKSQAHYLYQRHVTCNHPRNKKQPLNV